MSQFTPEQCEAAMSALFKKIEERGKPLSQDDIKEIQDILCKAGKPTWSARPRTYAVLRMINMVDLMDIFVAQNLFDLNFPYAIGLIPIEVKPQSARNKFFKKQSLVLTGIKAAETGQHATLGEQAHARDFDGDTPRLIPTDSFILAIAADPNFTNLKRLGGGGQGIVERVTSKLSLKDYARKSMLRSRKFEGSGDAEKAFRNELQNLRKLSHRHLVKYVGSYTDPRVFAILLLPVADMDLKTFLSRAPFPQSELSSVRGYFGCITAGIAYLHRSSIRHKDITPRNVLIKDNNIFVTDFGLSLDWSEVSKSKTDGPRGKVTRDYVAPEVWEETERGSGSDMWPLGCVFLDMVTILKGRSLEEKLQFFESNGSNSRNPRENYDAYLLWMRELRKLEPGRDTEPLLWTEKLISMNIDERGTADELLSAITSCEDEEDGYMYHCLHCADDFGSEFSVLPVPTGTGSDDDNGASGHLEIVDQLLRKGADINATGSAGGTALHEAAYQRHADIVRLLLKNPDIKTNIRGRNGDTPLTVAIKQRSELIVELLLECSTDADVQGLDTPKTVPTPLHVAAISRSAGIVQKLINRGAKVNIRLENDLG
ncbi:hypothetical protein BHE90_008812 [Fusarium euwallaceae]|uniref:EKC/KEOPS complex subunit BUD32 n=1 Tax=Fusarium euwallaceae TaxID=1147111 RepID=A0A430LM00_9HYPO|nr:hypothetical protein BHE90_008812 [Fusarium euwallaceae]